MSSVPIKGASSVVGAAQADRLEISELTAQMCLLVDARRWDELAGLFTDPVEVDHTSLFGGKPQTVAPRR